VTNSQATKIEVGSQSGDVIKYHLKSVLQLMTSANHEAIQLSTAIFSAKNHVQLVKSRCNPVVKESTEN
jgi:hypothetical protein